MKFVAILIGGVLLAGLVYPLPVLDSFLPQTPFRLGLDLLGGTHLVYEADLTLSADPEQAMAGVRDVIERRVNFFGVTEPVVQVEGENRLVVELAGIGDINQAIALIGETPFLEFREEVDPQESQAIQEAQAVGQRLGEDPFFKPTDLTGRHIQNAQVSFQKQVAISPEVVLNLTGEGATLFEAITQRNLGKQIAIYLDGQPISAPVVQSVINGGGAIISGNFTLNEAKELVTRLNAGALPVPINLVSQQTVGASLGQASVGQSLKAGLIGLLLVALYMIVFYRLPGGVAVFALAIYTVIVLMIYKILPVTLTLAGVAGFILSLGIAVDANVLIFARMREELKSGREIRSAVEEGFHRAWHSIRDTHVTTLIGAIGLYLFSASIVKGFALTLGIGVLVSLFTATVVTKESLLILLKGRLAKVPWLFN
ncbi:MAG: protein translocase subunit SecD [Candidatus Yanofskybacteria bacterium CG10_big_fil_rev_8_21_14_0_10_46_23]|uniref:Protein translocase subunit SecD n=1 Tax=Candidatus Yanofskybacteria bacterium CG10_big_fil_rev_8_21_14_0_10_46_23 TaxID=1975098 RepID=A0A2H0R4E1_9BACT|nr:MAG: protein translocase subunit SecD [Candidatus Yanofskybacteria bacterium CG10_big_fil_rev_8_21_14_0_10_46_23]